MYDYEKQHLQLLRSHLAECTVLLKHNGAFPLEAPCAIAAYGSGVRKTVKGGTGSGEVNSRYFVNVEQGLEDAGFTVTTKSWLDAYETVYAEARKQFFKDLKQEAKEHHAILALYAMGRNMPEPNYELPLDAEGDAAIYVLGRISGEGSDRTPEPGDVKLSATEKRDILALNEKYEKFMLVINAGGPVDLSGLEDVGNILVLSQLGVETGAALADILLGKQNPSGKLTTTWSAWEDYFPMPDFGDYNDTRYKEGVYVGYRYFDSVGKKALYPFGYGESFTTFSIGSLEGQAQGSRITLSATVTNTGSVAGKEVVQVYVSAPQGKLDKPYQDLAAFAKTDELAPGQSQTLQMSFDLRSMASYDEQTAAWILEKGNYILRVGNSSVHTQVAALAVVPETVITCQAKNTCGKTDFADWKPEALPATTVDAATPILPMDCAALLGDPVIYDTAYEIDPFVEKLTDRELIYANIGQFSGSLSIIGQASAQVPGAAGESTNEMIGKGFPAMVMADGPAGLRLTPQFYRDKKGKIQNVSSGGLADSIAELMPGIVRWGMKLMGNKKVPADARIQDQYCTAIPIGTALAQSWNLEFAKACGDIVGAEMERFGVHLWLAPALNIHRSILCGRNFEYFSEDPYISGKMAAALTLGVQAHPGCGTTIKHYCANNQETNRYGNNSRVSERAMREIYLKGFGICVEESQPKAVMTSYNLLNGQHTAERRDLTEDVLRREFGFRGIVMTDWVVGNGIMNNKKDIHPAVKPQLVAAAGGDVFMPGCKADFKNMEKGLADGSLTRQQLRINATRVYRMAKELTGK
jgi:beta-glucosidase